MRRDIRRFLVHAALVAGAVVPPGIVGAQAERGPTVAPAAASSSGGVNRPEHRQKPYVVLISFDGFRADYQDRFELPAFRRLARAGVRARGLVPVFPSLTFTNHYTLVTGLYAEHHGIVGNGFWDPVRQAAFDAQAVDDASWYRGEPIWVTAERQGMVTATFGWVGSELAIGGVRPTRWWGPAERRLPASAKMDTVLAWLALPAARRPHLLTVHVGEVDRAGHEFGPDSPEVRAAALQADSALGRLLDGLAAHPLGDSTYVAVVSDHGMAMVDHSQYQALPTLIDTTGVRFGHAGSGALASLFVAEGDTARARSLRDTLNRVLRHGRAYLRDEVPARLRYRADPRVGDVVVVMEQPHLVGASAEARATGTHGWEPVSPEMHGILLVSGPRARRGTMIPPVEGIDVYPLLVELLGLTPPPGVDGRAGRLHSLVIGK